MPVLILTELKAGIVVNQTAHLTYEDLDRAIYSKFLICGIRAKNTTIGKVVDIVQEIVRNEDDLRSPFDLIASIADISEIPPEFGLYVWLL